MERKKYIDMTQEELKECIEEEKEFVNSLKVSKHDIREEEEHLKDITRHELIIQQKKEEYLQSIKFNRGCVKDSKKKLKRVRVYIEGEKKFKINMEERLKVIEDIKEDLEKNPNHYK